MPKKTCEFKKKSMAWNVSDADPVPEDWPVPLAPAPPAETCEAAESVEDWESPPDPAPEGLTRLRSQM